MDFGFGNQLLWRFIMKKKHTIFKLPFFFRLTFTAMVLNKTSGYGICLSLKLHWHKTFDLWGG